MENKQLKTTNIHERSTPVVLPDLPNPNLVQKSFRKGRSPAEGYQRSFNIHLAETEDLYRRAMEPSQEIVSGISADRRANLYLILTRFLPRLIDKNVRGWPR